ncbi:hypothetical protein GJ496_007881 [Pomphorhynchus laevis]|nr:hypothetical protein GJ496_007881 [Pomphorhynchus laevis]
MRMLILDTIKMLCKENYTFGTSSDSNEALVDGFRIMRLPEKTAAHLHPIQPILSKKQINKDQFMLSSTAFAIGSGLALQQKIELNMVDRIGHLPFLRSSRLHSQLLRGTLDEVDDINAYFKDYVPNDGTFSGPAANMPHILMDKSDGIN